MTPMWVHKTRVPIWIRLSQMRFRRAMACKHSKAEAFPHLKPLWSPRSSDLTYHTSGIPLSQELQVLARIESLRSDAIQSDRFGGLNEYKQ